MGERFIIKIVILIITLEERFILYGIFRREAKFELITCGLGKPNQQSDSTLPVWLLT